MNSTAKHARQGERAAEALLEAAFSGQDQTGRLVRSLDTPAIRARADAEWAAMDSEGRLPEGWKYTPATVSA